MNTEVIIIRKPIKHLYLRINERGQLQVSAPTALPDAEIRQFIRQKQHWIQKHQQRRQVHQSPVGLCRCVDDGSFLFLGKNYPITQRTGKQNKISIDNATLVLTLRKNHQPATIYGLVDAFRKAKLLELARQYVNHYEPIIGVCINEIRTKRMKTKWATCNITAKRLWFNPALTRGDKKCIEYAVVHEMTHLLERYHNWRFYRLVADVMPDWQPWHNLLSG